MGGGGGGGAPLGIPRGGGGGGAPLGISVPNTTPSPPDPSATGAININFSLIM